MKIKEKKYALKIKVIIETLVYKEKLKIIYIYIYNNRKISPFSPNQENILKMYWYIKKKNGTTLGTA